MKRLSILGSTGSIGTQAIEVAAAADDLQICALAAGKNTALLEKQARKMKPQLVCIADKACYLDLKTRLADTEIRVLAGTEALCHAAAMDAADIVLNAVVGIAGLAPTLAAVDAGKRLALANKESLVAGGHLVTARAAKTGAQIIPVDSEHSAIFQCLNGENRGKIKRILLTASGGPFFGYSREKLKAVKKEDALRHPNWDMGAKITIDSATMMNKGLEVIEAKWLFDVPLDAIVPIIHRQSIVHSMVEFLDNAVIAQLGAPDMRLPILYALSYPERVAGICQPLDLLTCGPLTFEQPDGDTFSCLRLAFLAANMGGAAPTVLNGANEAAVALFLQDKIGFLDIPACVEGALEAAGSMPADTAEQVFAADCASREYVFLKGSR